MKKVMATVLLTLMFLVLLSACNSTKTLQALLAEDSNALNSVRDHNAKIVCSDYTVYNTGGGIEDEISATRYASGLREVNDRFVNYRYIVKDNQTGWLYIFENIRDIPTWLKHQK